MGSGRSLVPSLPGELNPANHRSWRRNVNYWEETGYTATAWESLGAYPVQGNYGCGRAHFFRATGATQTSTPRNGDLEDIEVMAVSPEEIHTLIREKKLVLLDCLSLVGALSVYFHE
jgi:hypothetical protein